MASLSSKITKELYIEAYNTSSIKNKQIEEKINFEISYLDGARLDIIGNTDYKYHVEFYNLDTNSLIYFSDISCGMFSAANKKYYVNWNIRVFNKSTNKVLLNEKINLEDKLVYISVDSNSLGDNIAWMPYIEEFRKKHNCRVIASTFWNSLFKGVYPEIHFINPGETAHGIYAMYKVGWHYNNSMDPVLPNTIPLQKAASNILGLDFEEIRPKIDFTPSERTISEKYITIAPHSTSGLKYWNNPTGWKDLIGYLKNSGYRIINVSKEGFELDGVEPAEDYSITATMNLIYHSEFLIGLSSGLSWLAWAINKPTVMISNFTLPDHEFHGGCIRITNHSVCHGCWNNPNFLFDKGDWWWCPIHKNTSRHFECHKSITADMVIEKIKPFLI